MKVRYREIRNLFSIPSPFFFFELTKTNKQLRAQVPGRLSQVPEGRLAAGEWPLGSAAFPPAAAATGPHAAPRVLAPGGRAGPGSPWRLLWACRTLLPAPGWASQDRLFQCVVTDPSCGSLGPRGPEPIGAAGHTATSVHECVLVSVGSAQPDGRKAPHLEALALQPHFQQPPLKASQRLGTVLLVEGPGWRRPLDTPTAQPWEGARV